MKYTETFDNKNKKIKETKEVNEVNKAAAPPAEQTIKDVEPTTRPGLDPTEGWALETQKQRVELSIWKETLVQSSGARSL